MKRAAVKKRPKQESDGTALIRRFGGALPKSAASPAVTAWLDTLNAKPAGKSVKTLITANLPLSRILSGIAETSPYLWGLIQADAARFVRLLESDPDHTLAALLAASFQAVASARSTDEAMRALRRMKADAALLIAFADIGGAWTVERVTSALTDTADTALRAALHFLLREAVKSKKLLPADLKNPEASSGYFVLAMGKMGGHELNYSSDIDLMVFFDAAAAKLKRGIEPAQFFIGITRALVKLLQERTPDGYVFRVDLRLRPDPSSTQIAISTQAALDYYESRGQNWERAALIKARPCAGDIAAGERLLRDLSPFVWRKYLDFATIGDVHEMKRQIHAYRGHGEIAVEGHNIKLGRGGIREIEFFAQTQQLIAGGRHQEMRGRSTVATLAVLAAGGWIDAKVRDELTAAYDFLRRVEHRLQMLADEQTHTLPADAAVLGTFARFLGFKDRNDFAAALVDHMRRVERHYVRLFERAPDYVAQRQNLSFDQADEADNYDRLAVMGYRRPQEVATSVRKWRDRAYGSLRGEQARAYLIELVPTIIDQFARAENPDAALAAFDRFLAGLRGGGRFFSLLRQNPELLRFIALILGTAPRLADILARSPQVIDALIDPSFFGSLPDEKRLAADLSYSLGEARGYEAALDAIRLFGQEQMFLIGARILSGSASAEQAGEFFARLADLLLRAVHKLVEEDFALTHGRIRGGTSAIVALGRLGAHEMTANSDLDLIVIYDFDQDHPNSDGKRPLYGGQYFARFTQRLISALTVQTNYGVLYQVDMRLRPSGRSGPLATQIGGFVNYQEGEAWTWEHMALTRARVVSAAPDFSRKIETAIRKVLRRRRNAPKIAADVADMRAAIAKEKGEADRWDLKYAAGGLVDIEFIAQYLQLTHAAATPDILDTSTARTLEKAARLGVLKPEDAEVLRPAVRLFHDLTQILRLCLPTAFDPKTASAGVLVLLARAADLPDFPSLAAYVEDTQQKVRACFMRIVGKMA
ncbi:MAG TPA: bifunctional [glutamine synthetase] adenylyltransferase/[glutamine synthetase]-adenylyl-L-tyrosine phosphorylase [Xanthobacteraceae bacterium]|jgi:glutamate-ammonia-ligase adenylyltransferase|nr:bifunctional [glutamine synthetase] adenylyltransferase/[glutamine synthetase]-adenylyl-L-tyrosine phosphorylase [Xanthobacteraceae bacterium]